MCDPKGGIKRNEIGWLKIQRYRDPVTKTGSLLLEVTELEKDLAVSDSDDKSGESVSVVAPVRENTPCRT